MYCTGQTPLSILNVSFGFVALVRTFFPFLSRVRIWICWFVLFFFLLHLLLPCSVARKNTCAKDGVVLVGL